MTNLKVHTNERAVSVEPTQEDLKLREYERADRDIRNFIAENDTLMQTLFDLVDTYNTAVLNMKDHIRNIAGDGKAEAGPFRRGKRPQYVKYDPSKVSVELLETLAYHKGLKIDTKILEALVLSGSIKSEQVSDAKNSEPGSFRVNGPKTVEFNL